MTDCTYHKQNSTGIEKRTKHLGIMLTEAEQKAAQELAARNRLSASAYFGNLVIQHLEDQGLLPEGYLKTIKQT